MTVFKQIVLNGATLSEFKFRREFELQGYLIAHPELLSLAEANEDFEVLDLIGVERRLSKGRVDLVVEYKSGMIAIVELKKGKVVEKDLEQLEKYLSDPAEFNKLKCLQDAKKGCLSKEFSFAFENKNVFGVLVGREIDGNVNAQIPGYKKAHKGRIVNAISIRR